MRMIKTSFVIIRIKVRFAAEYNFQVYNFVWKHLLLHKYIKTVNLQFLIFYHLVTFTTFTTQSNPIHQIILYCICRLKISIFVTEANKLIISVEFPIILGPLPPSPPFQGKVRICLNGVCAYAHCAFVGGVVATKLCIIISSFFLPSFLPRTSKFEGGGTQPSGFGFLVGSGRRSGWLCGS